ncbi:hypothetical protein INT43_003047 [Umbelopsis isabellina]|uniref:Uncharacterized protein n=1 Tax=Mortierella isabellina TaxID=91625 RepID=A0A8H7UCE7_MORIS|nr:hypothetical protein INT43_003047 [Umbelopsis isabellina]
MCFGDRAGFCCCWRKPSYDRYWKELKYPPELLNIKCVDSPKNDILEEVSLPPEFERLLLPEWKTAQYLRFVDLNVLEVPDSIKSLMAKIYIVHHGDAKPDYIHGFMDTFLRILSFDDYPLRMSWRYEPFARIFNRISYTTPSTIFDPRIEVLTTNHKKLIVLEYASKSPAEADDNENENRLITQLYVAMHDTVLYHRDVIYPVNVYAIRVLGTLFTFYKTVADEDYIKLTAKQFPNNKESMVVQRYPPKIGSGIPAYDIVNEDDRRQVLKCIASIKKWLTENCVNLSS